MPHRTHRGVSWVPSRRGYSVRARSSTTFSHVVIFALQRIDEDKNIESIEVQLDSLETFGQPHGLAADKGGMHVYRCHYGIASVGAWPMQGSAEAQQGPSG